MGHTRLIVGDNLTDFPCDVRTKTANLTTAKILLNSVISTLKAKIMEIHLKNFCLKTPLDHHEYMRLNINIIPNKSINQYNLCLLIHNNYVNIEV